VRLDGGCLCGAVRFELTREPVWSHYCHCSRCRKITGAACAANLFLPSDGLRFSQGQELLRTFRLPGSTHFRHVFCERCGSTMPFADEVLKLAVVPLGSLEGDHPGLAPRVHMFVDSKAPWHAISDSLRRNPGPGPWETEPAG
jgi:hypothetical protein